MKFQVEITLSASGYISVEADDKEAARKLVQHLEIGLDFTTADSSVDTTLLDPYADIRVDGVEEEEQAISVAPDAPPQSGEPSVPNKEDQTK